MTTCLHGTPPRRQNTARHHLRSGTFCPMKRSHLCSLNRDNKEPSTRLAHNFELRIIEGEKSRGLIFRVGSTEGVKRNLFLLAGRPPGGPRIVGSAWLCAQKSFTHFFNAVAF